MGRRSSPITRRAPRRAGRLPTSSTRRAGPARRRHRRPHSTLLDGARIVSGYLVHRSVPGPARHPFSFDYGRVDGVESCVYTGARLGALTASCSRASVRILRDEKVTGALVAIGPSSRRARGEGALRDAAQRRREPALHHVLGGPHAGGSRLITFSRAFPEAALGIMYCRRSRPPCRRRTR